MITRDRIIENLKNGIVTLEFTKKDGTNREMVATLDEKLFSYTPSEKSINRKTNETMSVWDVDAIGWRSFRWDSLKKVNGVELSDGV